MLRHINRIKSKEPRGKSFWCGCDRDMVKAGSKCYFCGAKAYKIRNKKISIMDCEPGS